MLPVLTKEEKVLHHFLYLLLLMAPKPPLPASASLSEDPSSYHLIPRDHSYSISTCLVLNAVPSLLSKLSLLQILLLSPSPHDLYFWISHSFFFFFSKPIVVNSIVLLNRLWLYLSNIIYHGPCGNSCLPAKSGLLYFLECCIYFICAPLQAWHYICAITE